MEADSLVKWILLDVYYLINALVRIRVSYVNSDSGVVVSNVKSLCRRYLKSVAFYVDLITLPPIYLLYYYYHVYHHGLFLINKVVRIVYLERYYVSCLVKRNVGRHLQWTFIIYSALFLMQTLASLWWSIHHYYDVVNIISVQACYLHILNIFAMAGLRHGLLKGILEMVVNLCIIIVATMMMMFLVQLFSKMLLTQNEYIHNYQDKIEFFKTYCCMEKSSPYIVQKCVYYLLQLYKIQRGDQIQKLFQYAPSYILQDHNLMLYGKHFERHVLFRHAHIDFVRQLLMHVKTYLFLPGDTIAQIGDKHGTMYFIETGEVLAITKSEDGKIRHSILADGESFGEMQGLYNLAQDKNYKAMKTSKLVTLCLDDWKHLLDWFPATKEYITSAADLYYG